MYLTRGPWGGRAQSAVWDWTLLGPVQCTTVRSGFQLCILKPRDCKETNTLSTNQVCKRVQTLDLVWSRCRNSSISTKIFIKTSKLPIITFFIGLWVNNKLRIENKNVATSHGHLLVCRCPSSSYQQISFLVVISLFHQSRFVIRKIRPTQTHNNFKSVSDLV